MNLKQARALRKELEAIIALKKELCDLNCDGLSSGNALNMLVVFHECCETLPRKHKVPVLVWVDQPHVNVSVTHPGGKPPTELGTTYGVFTHLFWLDDLTEKQKYKLTIKAQKTGFEDASEDHDLDRNPSDATKPPYGSPPIFNYPSSDGQAVQTNFAAWGTAPADECPCTAWLVDGSGNTYPGSPIPGQPLGSWGFSFQNIPGSPAPGTPYTLYVRTSTGDQATRMVNVENLI